MIDDIVGFKKLNPDSKIVFVCHGYKDWYKQIEEYVSLWVEHSFKHLITKEQFESRGLKIAFIPLAANEDTFFPIGTKRIFDISFIGQFGSKGHGERDEQYFLFPAIDKYDGIFGGFSYKGQQFPPVPHSSLNDVYNICKINLNFHYPAQKDDCPKDITTYLDFNGRVFEIAMSGNFQLCDAAYTMDIGFKDAIIVGDKTTWMDMIEYYLKNDDKREECARKSREIALDKHTWKQRMSELLAHL